VNLIRLIPAEEVEMQEPSSAHPALAHHRRALENYSRFAFTSGAESFSRFTRGDVARHAKAGRRMRAVFSYAQRIGKAANMDIWFPDEANKTPALSVRWAAIREIEILQEADNLVIEDLQVENLNKALFRDYPKMRSGGYRIVMAMVGDYCPGDHRDDLSIADALLQERMESLVNIMWLEEWSAAMTKALRQPSASTWQIAEQLPHVAAGFDAAALFNKNHKKEAALRQFMDCLRELPARHVDQDMTIGLKLPIHSNRTIWTYIPEESERAGSFQSFLRNVFDKFDGISLAAHRDGGALKPEMATPAFMRGYGDRGLNGQSRFEV
jgi:DNA segregation ATPase FtsK/SpoIIIE-like protein